MWHATWNRLLHSRRRLILTVFAVTIGVTFLTGSLVLADSTRSALERSYTQVYTDVDVVVRGPEPVGESPFGNGAAPLPASTVATLRDVAGVANAEGRISSVAQVAASNAADAAGEPAIAMAVPVDPASAAVEMRSGRLPSGTRDVVLDADGATALGVQPGDRVDVLLRVDRSPPPSRARSASARSTDSLVARGCCSTARRPRPSSVMQASPTSSSGAPPVSRLPSSAKRSPPRSPTTCRSSPPRRPRAVTPPPRPGRPGWSAASSWLWLSSHC